MASFIRMQCDLGSDFSFSSNLSSNFMISNGFYLDILAHIQVNPDRYIFKMADDGMVHKDSTQNYIYTFSMLFTGPRQIGQVV